MAAPLVTTLDEARAAILAFGPEAARSPALAARMAYHRAWLAVKADGGKADRGKSGGGWHYAPARWAGHPRLDTEAYLAQGEALDGRRSDAALAAWFAPVADPRRHEKHMRRLRAMFARHGAGQAPNARTRVLEVSVPEGGSERSEEKRLVDLMEAVFRGLSVPAQAALRRRIGG